MHRLFNLKKIFTIVVLFFCATFAGHSQAHVLRDSVVSYAHQFLHTPYRMGGSTPKAFDCSGFTSYVFRNFGYDLNRTSGEQLKNAVEIVAKEELQPGDLVFFKGRNSKSNRIGHVGIIVEAYENGDFSFIHASTTRGVTVTTGNDGYYKSRFITAGRVIPDREEPLSPINPHPISLTEVKIPQLAYLN